MRIATFNVQNLRLRRKDGRPRLDGARDGDVPADEGPEAAALDPIDRRLTAAVLRQADADVVALQEVFDQDTLDWFHDAYLLPAGTGAYPHRICLPGNDGRGLDVALMSRRSLDEAVSHAAVTPENLGLDAPPGHAGTERIFRRDCLMVRIGRLTLYVCHFKAPYPDAEAARRVRRLEAAAVRRLIERRWADPGVALWLVLGDLNEPGGGPPEDAQAEGTRCKRARAITPLTDGFAVDLVTRMPEEERWSFRDLGSGRYSRPDGLLASPALAAAWPAARPCFLRGGLERDTRRFRGPHLPGVGPHRPHASDHAALVIDLPGL